MVIKLDKRFIRNADIYILLPHRGRFSDETICRVKRLRLVQGHMVEKGRSKLVRRVHLFVFVRHNYQRKHVPWRYCQSVAVSRLTES